MLILKPANWADLQHYKDRSPPWIKLHKKLLDNYEWHSLPVASRALAPMLWLLASEHADGEIEATPEKLAFRLRMTTQEARESVTPLIHKGFFIVVQDDSAALADCKQDACLETETETETETEKHPIKSGEPADAGPFGIFWRAYPRRVGKGAALKIFTRLKVKPELLNAMLVAIAEQRKSPAWTKDSGQFIPHPATWLNQARWQDETAVDTAPDQAVVPAGPDPALAKLDDDERNRAPMPDAIREKIADLTRHVTGPFSQGARQ